LSWDDLNWSLTLPATVLVFANYVTEVVLFRGIIGENKVISPTFTFKSLPEKLPKIAATPISYA